MSAPQLSPVVQPPKPLHLLRLLCFILLPLVIVGFIAEDIAERQRFHFETPMMLWIHAHTSPALLQFSLLMHHIGGPIVMGAVFVIIPVLLWFTQRRYLALFSLYGLGGAVLLNGTMKVLFHRTRPELWPRNVIENGPSFPSGHSMFAAALWTTLFLISPKHWRPAVGIIGVIYTLLMAFSRLVLGVHYPTDVLCGILTGLAWVYGVYSLMNQVEARRRLLSSDTNYAVSHDQSR